MRAPPRGTTHIITYDGDPKDLGAFGAPRLRCTPLLAAICVALIGLVLVGIGACMAGFLPHELLAKIAGLVLVVVGVCMIVGGLGFWVYDCISGSSSANRHRAQQRPASSPPRPLNAQSAGYTPAPQAAPPQQTQPYAPPTAQQAPSRPMVAAAPKAPPPTRPMRTSQANPQNEIREYTAPPQKLQQAPRAQPQRQIREEPPPAYDIVAAQDTRIRSEPQPVSSSHSRTAHHMREQRKLMSSTAV